MNANKINVMVLKKEEGSVCEFIENGRHLEPISEFKNLGFVLDESGRVPGNEIVGEECYESDQVEGKCLMLVKYLIFEVCIVT